MEICCNLNNRFYSNTEKLEKKYLPVDYMTLRKTATFLIKSILENIIEECAFT